MLAEMSIGKKKVEAQEKALRMIQRAHYSHLRSVLFSSSRQTLVNKIHRPPSIKPLSSTIKPQSIQSLTTTTTSLSMEAAHGVNSSEKVTPSMKRGALIVLEGLDRSGKSSQCSLLSSHLYSQGFEVESWRFPDRTTGVGSMISDYLSSQQDMDDRTVHLLFSANRWEKRSLMESKLLSGVSLIVDRYSYSGVAFSAAKGLDLGWCKAPEAGLPAPDLVFYLDISPEKAAERGGYGGERYEHLDFQKKVAEFYNILSDSTWQNVDASLPKDSIHDTLKELSVKCIECCKKGKELSRLWP